MPVQRIAYSMDEAARALGLSRVALWRHVYAGRVSTFRLGRRRLVPAEELARLTQQGENV